MFERRVIHIRWCVAVAVGVDCKVCEAEVRLCCSRCGWFWKPIGSSRPIGMGGGATANGSSIPRGALVVLEGLDRTGKSTQARLLAHSLQSAGHRVEQLRFPDRSTTVGKEINRILCGELSASAEHVHSLFSQNRWEWRESMRSKLLQGTCLVVDRYAYSGAVYTASKASSNLSLQQSMQHDDGLLAPDVPIYLRMDASSAAARSGYGAEAYEDEEFQSCVASHFEAFVQQHLLCPIDAAGSENEVASRIFAATLPTVEQCCAGAPLTLLWDYRKEDERE